ncbi:hypothetical protein [Flavobacterium sp. WC2509]|uniref:hypothetical protein n=1 Tax=Flavobacterium sp. WC2509 TaxID=3461406 RepID=UPI004043B704
MIKKILLMSLVVSQLTISCSSDNSSEESLADQIASITGLPYSKLTPAEQKVKLEAEANEMLVQLDKTKNLSAIETLENLDRLLDISVVDIFNGKNDNKVEDIINVSGVYGIYTWNNAQKVWVKTESKTELTFIFPAKATQTTNNASFSTKSTSSEVKVPVEESSNWQTNTTVNDYFFLPSTVDATLTIDGTQAATFSQTAKYSNANGTTPEEFGYKMSLNGYSWEISSKKATESSVKALFSNNGKNLIEFNSGSTADIDKLLSGEELAQYRGKANGLITLMDNFAIVANMDLATNATDEAALEKNNIRPTQPSYNDPKADFKAYYTALNAYEKKQSESAAATFNKNMKLILVSKKDGTKIADIVQHSEKSGNDYVFTLPVWDAQYKYWSYSSNGESFSQPYLDEVYYLKFNDATEVEMGAYFSTGFEKFQSKFEDFINAF